MNAFDFGGFNSSDEEGDNSLNDSTTNSSGLGSSK